MKNEEGKIFLDGDFNNSYESRVRNSGNKNGQKMKMDRSTDTLYNETKTSSNESNHVKGSEDSRKLDGVPASGHNRSRSIARCVPVNAKDIH